MGWQDNFHSRFVAWMKIILPVAALGILATLFLISNNFDPSKSIPVTEIDLRQRAHDLGATDAAFAGVTSGGDQVMLAAERARPTIDDVRMIEAENVTAELRLVSGVVIDVTADRADMHQGRNTATLDGRVNVSTTTGYRITTNRLDARFDDLYAESPGPVRGVGPPGDLEAGRMVLTSDAETGNAHLIFTDGVKLVYKPQVSEE